MSDLIIKNVETISYLKYREVRDLGKYFDRDQDYDPREWPLFVDTTKKVKDVFSDKMCIVHLHNDGLECAPIVNRLTENSYSKIKYTVSRLAEISPDIDNSFFKIVKRIESLYINLEPPFAGYGYHKPCYSVFCNKNTVQKRYEKIQRLKEQAKDVVDLQSPVILIKARKPETKKRIGQSSSIPQYKQLLKTSLTSQSLSNQIAAQSPGLSRLDSFLQTLPRNMNVGVDQPVLDIDKPNICVFCLARKKSTFRAASSSVRRTRMLRTNVTLYSGWFLLAATIKRDLVMKTRLLRLLQRKEPIMYHNQCKGFYLNNVKYPDKETCDNLKELLCCLFTDDDMPNINPRLLTPAVKTPVCKPENTANDDASVKDENYDDFKCEFGESEHSESQMWNSLNSDDNFTGTSENTDFNIHSMNHDDNTNMHDASSSEISEAYTQFCDIVRTRIFDNSDVAKMTALYKIYNDLAVKFCTNDRDILTYDSLKQELVKTFPDLVIEKISRFSAELVFKSE